MGNSSKGEFNNFVTHFCKLHSHNFFHFLLYFHLFYTDGKATDQPCVNDSPNSELVKGNVMRQDLHLFKCSDSIFPVYN